MVKRGRVTSCKELAKELVKRGKTTISTEAINLKPPLADQVQVQKKGGIKASGAWRYPNNQIQRATNLGGKTNLKGVPYTDDKDGLARRKHESSFFITLNTNKKAKIGEKETEIAMTAAKEVLETLGTDASLCTYLKFGPKNTHYAHDRYSDVIQSVEWKPCVELGEQQSRLHCHIILTVNHYSQVQINVPILQQLFKDLYNAEVRANGASSLMINRRPYIHVKLLPQSSWAMVMRQYILKAMNPSKDVPAVFLDPSVTEDFPDASAPSN